MDLPDRFRAQLASLGLPSGPALVAVSGGLDSVVLLDLLHRIEHPGRELVVAHADHGIHPMSASVAGMVCAFAAGLGLRCEVERLELGPGTGETTAREARYRWLFAVRERLGASLIFTAHHGEDQAETVLMRALEGSGPGGLAGIPAVSGALVRPLLTFRRQELTRYARERSLPVWVDPANSDPAHLRSWVRCDVLPAIRKRLPNVDDRLRRLGTQAARERAALDAVLDLLPGLEPRDEEGGISVAAAPLAAYDSALAQTLIIAAARRSGLILGPVRAARAWRLVLAGDSGREAPLGEGWRAELSFGRLRLVRAAGGEPGGILPLTGHRGEIPWGEWRIVWRPDQAPERQGRSSRTAWFSAGNLVVRRWRPGDKVRPLAGAGRRLVVRCFQDARVPRRSRSAWPVLAAPNGASPDTVVWIPGVCRSDALLPPAGAEARRVDVEHA
ncbi:MAG TPA: tRNA lysidine(34) synthetase TilS [Gemmatimonadales bacterium]|nr:tRNA lysidine(34) synthetase TilS [Gemmatimonadales bacterium]